MLTLIKGAQCYCPRFRGVMDIVIADTKILAMGASGSFSTNSLIDQEISCEGLLAFPGIIDQHVHIIGGGGEEGFCSRLPELAADEIFLAGVTTVVGLLGADDRTKSLASLLAKARALEEQGVTAYIYTGSYAVPVVTFTGDITSDLVLIDKVIGTGEIAISDHRSSHPDFHSLRKVAHRTHLGGLISGKPGIVHIHLGEGKTMMEPLLQLIQYTEFPLEQFVPTHVNRTRNLFSQAIEFLKLGGNIDLTAGETVGISVPEAVSRLMRSGIKLDKVTVSSDANGSCPGGAPGKMKTLYDDMANCVRQKQVDIESAFGFVTENVAKVLKLYPRKGVLQPGSDADILITDQGLNLQKLISKGVLRVDNGSIV